jgi:hypothetical protein
MLDVVDPYACGINTAGPSNLDRGRRWPHDADLDAYSRPSCRAERPFGDIEELKRNLGAVPAPAVRLQLGNGPYTVMDKFGQHPDHCIVKTPHAGSSPDCKQ